MKEPWASSSLSQPKKSKGQWHVPRMHRHCFSFFQIKPCRYSDSDALHVPAVKAVASVRLFSSRFNVLHSARALVYCGDCHVDVENVRDIRLCKCTHRRKGPRCSVFATVCRCSNSIRKANQLGLHLYCMACGSVEANR